MDHDDIHTNVREWHPHQKLHEGDGCGGQLRVGEPHVNDVLGAPGVPEDLQALHSRRHGHEPQHRQLKKLLVHRKGSTRAFPSHQLIEHPVLIGGKCT